jgi:hypothetical protein
MKPLQQNTGALSADWLNQQSIFQLLDAVQIPSGLDAVFGLDEMPDFANLVGLRMVVFAHDHVEQDCRLQFRADFAHFQQFRVQFQHVGAVFLAGGFKLILNLGEYLVGRQASDFGEVAVIPGLLQRLEGGFGAGQKRRRVETGRHGDVLAEVGVLLKILHSRLSAWLVFVKQDIGIESGRVR